MNILYYVFTILYHIKNLFNYIITIVYNAFNVKLRLVSSILIKSKYDKKNTKIKRSFALQKFFL